MFKKSNKVVLVVVLVALLLLAIVGYAGAAQPDKPQDLAPQVVAQATEEATAEAMAEADPSKWCSGMNIRFFAGGDAGGPFAKIVNEGAIYAEKNLGPNVEYIYSGWNNEKMLDQLRDAIAAQPDGIAFMGHAGDDAVMPLAKQAAEAGILMMYQNVDVPKVREMYGGGYVGANLSSQGRALAAEAIRRLELDVAEDHILVIGPWAMPGRNIRELGVAEYFEEQGFTVVRGDDSNTAGDNLLLQPTITGAVLDDPQIKVIVYSGATISSSKQYLTSLGKGPGDIYNIGFDISPEIIQGFEEGWIQLTSDQQPFLQGYMPIVSLCGSWKFNLSPLNVDTGAGFVTPENYQTLVELAAMNVR
jgi:simple sugar transport system substrate-binding protein